MGVRSEQSSNESPHTLFLLYELGHIEELERFLRERPEERADSLVVAFSLDIEEKLSERRIPFSSGRKYKQAFPDLLKVEDEMMEAFFIDHRWAAFNYRGVAMATTFQFMFRVYLQRLWYYGNLFVSIVEAHPSVRRFMLFAPGGGIVSQVAGGLAWREINVVVDCAKMIGVTARITVDIVPLPLSRASLGNSVRSLAFMMQRALFSFFLTAWNTIITVLRRPHHPRLIISDHWKNVGQCIELLKEGECIFLDRMEIRRIPLRALLRYRMRFVHSENFISRAMRRRAKERAQEFAKIWHGVRTSITPVFVCRGYSLDALLLDVIDDIVKNFEKLICEIEGTYAMYGRVQPDVVLLRASVSGQTHFSVLPLVAKKCDIPSLELQHGLEYLGTGSISRKHAAEYMAVYGPLVKKELLSIGYAPEKVHAIGSPRFDSYRLDATGDKKAEQPRPFTVLCVAPHVSPLEGYDSYSAEDYFNAVARAVEPIQNVHVIIKLRPGPANEGLLRAISARAFSRVSHSIMKSEPMSHVFAQVDVVVSCYSTIILEALQHAVPVIIPALNPIEASIVRFHFSSYAHALYTAYTHNELSKILAELAMHPETRDRVRGDAQVFLARNFCFDGNSSQRLAALIAKIAARSTTIS